MERTVLYLLMLVQGCMLTFHCKTEAAIRDLGCQLGIVASPDNMKAVLSGY